MNKILKKYRELPKEIYILSIATLINRTGDFVVPFLTLYLSQKLGISIPLTGIIVAAAGFIMIPGSYISGKLNDMYNSKIVYVVCQSLAAVLLIPCAFIKNPYITVPLLLMFSLFSSMVRTPTMAMISDLLPTEQRKLGFTIRYIGINIGVAIGLAIAGFLYNYSTVILFLGDAITMIFSVLIISIGIKGSKIKTIRLKNIGVNEKREEGHILNILLNRKPLILYMLFSSMLMIIFEQTKFALPLTLNYRFGKDGPVLFGFIISLNAITATIFALFIHRITINIRPISQIIIGGLFFTIGFSLYSITNSFTTFVLTTIFWSIGEVFVFTNATVFVMNHSPENFRGRLTSVYTIFLTLMATLGILLTERVISKFGLLNSWLVLGFLTLFSVFMLFNIKIRYYKE